MITLLFNEEYTLRIRRSYQYLTRYEEEPLVSKNLDDSGKLHLHKDGCFGNSTHNKHSNDSSEEQSSQVKSQGKPDSLFTWLVRKVRSFYRF